MDNDEMRKDLLSRRSQLEKELAAAIKTRNDMDGKMQSRYDTQREEWAMQCDIIETQIERLDKLIAQLADVHSTPVQEVTRGSKITISIDGDDPETYVLLEQGGGVQFAGIAILSTQSPIGRGLLGAKEGETRVVDVNGQKLSVHLLEIATIQTV